MINCSPHKKFLMAALLMGCFFVYSCENDTRVISDLTKKVVLKEEATNIESLLSQNGVVKARLTAPLMIRVFGDTLYAEFPNSLHCEFYNDSTVVESWLDSRYGKYYEGIGKVYLKDSVVVITTKGDTLRSPDLWWDQNTKKFYTDQYAVYTGIGKNIHGGKGLVATQDLSSVIFNQPTGTVQVSESGIPK
jgi:LPS export ABC transporter protein LptC